MQNIENHSVSINKMIIIIAGSVSLVITCIAYAYGQENRINKVETSDAIQEARLAKLEQFQEKANEAIITTPLKLDTLAKSVSEMKLDIKTYLIKR